MRIMDACTEYIGFDDRKMIIIGILIISVITHPILMDVPYLEYLSSPISIIESILWTSMYWITLRMMMISVRKRFPGISQNPKRIILAAIFVIALAPILSIVVGETCGYLFGEDPDISRPLKYTLVYILAFGIMAIYEATYYFYQYKLAIAETEKLKTAQVQSQLENLRNQISPHFLFNSLNTLMNLIPKDQNRAMNYLSKLSKFYRYTVSNQDESLVLVSTEVENASNFADLLHERFGENISIDIECELANGKKILPLSLQLLIENAVKHNIVSKSKPLQVNIYCSNDGYIHIENNLQRKIQSVTSTGVGLENIKKRFTYFTDRKVSITETKDQYLISLPLIDQI